MVTPMQKGLTVSVTDKELQDFYTQGQDAAALLTPKPKALTASTAMTLNTDVPLSDGAIAPATHDLPPATQGMAPANIRAIAPAAPTLSPATQGLTPAAIMPDVSTVHGNNATVPGLSGMNVEGEKGGFTMQTAAGQKQLQDNLKAPYNSFQDATAAILTKRPEAAAGLYMPSGGGTGVVPEQAENSDAIIRRIATPTAEQTRQEQTAVLYNNAAKLGLTVTGGDANTVFYAPQPGAKEQYLWSDTPNSSQTALTAAKEAIQKRLGYVPVDYETNREKYDTVMLSQVPELDRTQKGLEQHVATAKENAAARVEAAGLLAEAKKEAAKETAASRIEAAKQHRAERQGLINNETLQARRDLGTRIREAQRGYLASVKKGRPEEVNAAIDMIEAINDDAKAMGVVPLPVPKRMETDEEKAAVEQQAVDNLNKQKPWYKFGEPKTEDVEAEVNRLKRSGTSAVPIKPQAAKATLDGNTVTFQGKSYPLNNDGTVTVNGRRYRVQ